MRLVFGIVRVVHPLPVFLVVTTSTLLVALVSANHAGAWLLTRCAGVVLSSQVSVGALNDYLDRASDALHQPEKPIPAGDCPAGVALALVILGLLSTIALGLTLGPIPLVLALLGTAAGLAYDLWLKPTPASFTAYIVGFLTLFSWVLVVSGRFSVPLLAAYPAGAMVLTAAYLAQSFPDIETDASLGQRGLAVVLGPRRTLLTILVLYSPVCLATIAAALAHSDYPACLLALLGGMLVVLAWRRAATRALDRPERKRLFRLLAPAVAVLVLGGLMLLVQLS